MAIEVTPTPLISNSFVLAILLFLTGLCTFQFQESERLQAQITKCGEMRTSDIKEMLLRSDQDFEQNIQAQKGRGIKRVDSVTHESDSLARHLTKILKRP